MINLPLQTVIDKINDALTDGNRATLHENSIRFIINEPQDKMMKIMEYMDLVEDVTGNSANLYQFDIVYKKEHNV
ncbi:hypothetical protein FO440_20680 [Mucilaginibacter corticis]|uniref:Uncharacterized protein n=1 Tax=Mucilaginibacter corticis TaxID=2597670 RepID=A0A556MG54_9SPHI|nr:hypothetical protein [Mucilaginibacter corticis]TSJ38916.1 hypothetical protein FO440_20680 [Mucilaginibacter corticis]